MVKPSPFEPQLSSERKPFSFQIVRATDSKQGGFTVNINPGLKVIPDGLLKEVTGGVVRRPGNPFVHVDWKDLGGWVGSGAVVGGLEGAARGGPKGAIRDATAGALLGGIAWGVQNTLNPPSSVPGVGGMPVQIPCPSGPNPQPTYGRMQPTYRASYR